MKIRKLSRSLVLGIIAVTMQSRADQIGGLYAAAYGKPADPTVIFLHGGPGYNSFSFEQSTAPVLVKRGYRVIVFDQRGSGRSEPASLSAYTFKNATDDLQSVLDFYKVRNPIVVGHSYGGTLAVKYAQAHPSSYRAILLADAPMDQPETVKAILDHCEAFYSAANDSTDLGYIAQLRSVIFKPTGYSITYDLGGFIFFHATHCKLYSPKNLSLDAVAIWKGLRESPLAQLLSLSQPDPFHGFIDNAGWLTINIVPDLSFVSNTYAIFGNEDGLFDRVHFSEIKNALPHGHSVFLNDASHNIFIDQQTAFVNFVDLIRDQTK